MININAVLGIFFMGVAIFDSALYWLKIQKEPARPWLVQSREQGFGESVTNVLGEHDIW